MTERQDTLTKYVSNMLALTKHIHQAIERQLDDNDLKKTPDADQYIASPSDSNRRYSRRE